MCVECDLAEPESLASPGGSAPGVVNGILSCIIQHSSGSPINLRLNPFLIRICTKT